MKRRRWRGESLLAAALLAALQPAAQESTNLRPRTLPAQLRPATGAAAAVGTPIPPPAFQSVSRPMVLAPTPALEMTNGIIAFDREIQEVRLASGVPEAHFLFHFTNVSSHSLTITNVATSCGCTAVELPVLPWVLRAGERGVLPVTLDVAGKKGQIAKTLQVRTDRGYRTLMIRADLAASTDPAD